MERSRGQVILVAALGIAVTFVALALVTNTVIYTENLATRETANGQDAIAYEHAVEDGAAGLLALANRYNASSHDTIRNRFVADVSDLSNATEIESGRNGRLADVSVVAMTNGARISQNATRNLTDVNGTRNWTLATDVSRTRRFALEVSADSLSASAPFAVVVDGEADQWRATFRPDGGDVAVTISNASASVTCTGAGATSVVDLTEGTVDGEPCPAPPFGAGVSAPYTVEFLNGTNAVGRYVLFVDVPPGAIDSSPYASDPADDPNLEPAVYSSTLAVSLRGPDVTYETNVTVAPADSPEGERYGTVP